MNFQKYHKENPQIYREFVRIAHQAKAKGFAHYSAKGVFEIIRWQTKTQGNDGFKVNNSYTADYARLMMSEYPEFEGFFWTRSLLSPRIK